jgi:hypothetical protein
VLASTVEEWGKRLMGLMMVLGLLRERCGELVLWVGG